MDLLIRRREWGRRKGGPTNDPDPADRYGVLVAAAADLNQRGADGLVAMDAAGPPEASLKTPDGLCRPLGC